MIIRIIRDKQNDSFTLGEVFGYIDGEVVFSGFSVENPWMDNARYISRVPAGTYEAFCRTSPSNGEVIELKDVPGRSHIQLHVANWSKDVSGCIGVGKKRISNGVEDSILAMNELYGRAFEQDQITVEIIDLFLPERKGDEIDYRNIEPPDNAFEGLDYLVYDPVKVSRITVTQPKPTMLTRLKSLIQPKTWIGKAIGVLSSLVGIPTVGSALENDLTILAITALAMAAAYLFSWSKEEFQDFIKFLQGVQQRGDKK
jgi:hypothetical protein